MKSGTSSASHKVWRTLGVSSWPGTGCRSSAKYIIREDNSSAGSWLCFASRVKMVMMMMMIIRSRCSLLAIRCTRCLTSARYTSIFVGIFARGTGTIQGIDQPGQSPSVLILPTARYILEWPIKRDRSLFKEWSNAVETWTKLINYVFVFEHTHFTIGYWTL